jgi:hypothetical protein
MGEIEGSEGVKEVRGVGDGYEFGARRSSRHNRWRGAVSPRLDHVQVESKLHSTHPANSVSLTLSLFATVSLRDTHRSR